MARVATAIVDASSYMTLATADHEGRPWASPTWFAAHVLGEGDEQVAVELGGS